jgi:hypothetical protein
VLVVYRYSMMSPDMLRVSALKQREESKVRAGGCSACRASCEPPARLPSSLQLLSHAPPAPPTRAALTRTAHAYRRRGRCARS